MANIWRRQPSDRVISSDFFKKSNSGVSQSVADDFFEASGLNNYSLSVSAATYTQSNTAIGLLYGRSVPITVASYSVSATNINFSKGFALAVSSMSASLANSPINFLLGRSLSVSTQSYALTNNSLNLLAGRSLPVVTAAYAQSNSDAGLAKGYKLSVAQQSYNESATDISLLAARLLAVSKQDYALNLISIDLLAGKKLSIAQQSYVLNLVDVGLTYTPGTTNYELAVDVLECLVGLNSIGLLKDNLLFLDRIQLSLALNDVDLTSSVVNNYTIQVSNHTMGIRFKDSVFVFSKANRPRKRGFRRLR